MITKKEIKKIKEWLPEGFIKQIADKTEFSESTVQKFFSGARYNKVIHECALEIAESNKSEIESLKLRGQLL